jgi:hypothetical protein
VPLKTQERKSEGKLQQEEILTKESNPKVDNRK